MAARITLPSSPLVIEKPAVDMSLLREYRLGRIRRQLAAADTPFCVLVSPLSIRYAVDNREYQGFQSRLPTQYLFVPADGPVIQFGGTHRDYPVVDDYRKPRRLNVFDGGLNLYDYAREFAEDAKRFLAELGLKNERRVAVEMLNPSVTQAMLQAGLDPVDAEPLMERAKCIKSAEELVCMRHCVEVAEHGIALMREATRPGVRETELWSILHQVNIVHDGSWFDGRMLCSGPRTNPWLQEATERRVNAGELVAFDTDMIGPFGYCADISRTWLCGDVAPNEQQRTVYRLAHDEIEHNMGLLKPGVSFEEFSRRAFPMPAEYVARRYPCVAHGVGMSDEYPKIAYTQDWDDWGYDGVFEENMAICIESFTGSDKGGEGVKLEQMVLVTESGCEPLSTYPFETTLLQSGTFRFIVDKHSTYPQ